MRFYMVAGTPVHHLSLRALVTRVTQTGGCAMLSRMLGFYRTAP